MQKKCLILLFLLLTVCVFAQQPEHRKPKSHGPKHPLIAALESPTFSQEERARLKVLAAKDPKQFSMEIRKHFLLLRKKESMRILELRKAVLEAKTPAEKEKAQQELRECLLKRAEQRLAFHKKVLDETERNIRMMQARCEKLRKEYEERTQKKAELLEKEMAEILSDTPPKKLLMSAEWDPEKEPKRTPR